MSDFLCKHCGHRCHSWRDGWRHAASRYLGPYDHKPEGVTYAEYYGDDPDELAALRRALGRDDD